MTNSKKAGRYERVILQLEGLLSKPGDINSRMATISSVLHYKMDGFFWTGFYMLNNGELMVRVYQGPIACQLLKKDTGVCWAGINQQKTIVVADVNDFTDHIACDARSQSEIVIPVRDKNGDIVGVLDIDSSVLNTFDETDQHYLEKIVAMIYA
jgi:L-methionine (R)-S-oxide reductase